MNKEKILRGLFYLSGFSITVMMTAVSFYADLLVIGFILLPFVFFFAYKGLKSISEAIFE